MGTWEGCPILLSRFHRKKGSYESFDLTNRECYWRSDRLSCRSENCISLAGLRKYFTVFLWQGPVKLCRFDWFVWFVEWRILLTIRQVELLIGKLHLISGTYKILHDILVVGPWWNFVASIDSFNSSNGEVYWQFLIFSTCFFHFWHSLSYSP